MYDFYEHLNEKTYEEQKEAIKEEGWAIEYIENPSPNEGRWFSLCTHEDVQ